MQIITTSDWHLGNLFHGNDRLPEHKHFLAWLLDQIREHKPDALLVAGDIFDNGNPSAAAQSAYYAFLAQANEACPQMQVIITAGNHDSASRLEAPRMLLTRHNVEVRGTISHVYQQNEDGRQRLVDYDDLMIPVIDSEGQEVIVLAVPFLRSDVLQGASYSEGVNTFLRTLTDEARTKYPSRPLVMMAHMYAKGAEIAQEGASEKIIIGGQEEVNMEGWHDHPDYMTCGHIHKRQHIWHTNWARYTGSILPMSFAEVDYHHGVDLVTIDGKNINVDFLAYEHQHKLCTLPKDDTPMSPKKLQKLIKAELTDRVDGQLSDSYPYLTLKVSLDKVDNDAIRELEELVATKDAVLCRIQKIMPNIDVTTMHGGERIQSLDDIVNRDPIDTLREAYAIKHQTEMSEHQEQMLRDLLNEE